MKNYEILPNGVEVVYSFGSVPDKEKKNILFLAGTTSWNGNLVDESWRRYFIERIAKEDGGRAHRHPEQGRRRNHPPFRRISRRRMRRYRQTEKPRFAH